ncbi:3-deoxy-7-phosphoheptulonate synthase [Halofilum ochraceum]|uniref:3-deoxy-7-phosphoheptulonate synthase n=1 Tax=Halofilum ochraceum TaxID=1611323 RepID=UPI0008355329|nr:3-deoxy-7-phosphoheptulonate synthase [Halofilum ochraceum]
MTYQTGDLRIREIRELKSPAEMIKPTDRAAETVHFGREQVQRIMDGDDDRLVVIVGPCSIHDPEAARDYATRLQRMREELGDDLLIIMRVYFEKPRTTVGWKGLINDPHLDGSFDINAGLETARQLLLDLADMQLPAGTEFLDLISPQYVADLVTWGAIGARTTESQVHRELASGLSCPVGFKNGTGGDVQIAVDAIGSASQPHHFLGVTAEGRSAIVETTGNPYSHVILRGGKQPNYDASSVDDVAEMLANAGLPQRIMIDASHANSRKKPERQADVARDIAHQVGRGDRRIFGMMLESHLVEGKQSGDGELTYGQSITDACMGWERTEGVLREIAESVRKRRKGEG